MERHINFLHFLIKPKIHKYLKDTVFTPVHTICGSALKFKIIVLTSLSGFQNIFRIFMTLKMLGKDGHFRNMSTITSKYLQKQARKSFYTYLE